MIWDRPTKEPWEISLITIIAYVLLREAREEWLGDLREDLFELTARGINRFIRMLIALARAGTLGLALLRIKFSDLVSPGKKSPM